MDGWMYLYTELIAGGLGVGATQRETDLDEWLAHRVTLGIRASLSARIGREPLHCLDPEELSSKTPWGRGEQTRQLGQCV